MTYKEVMQELVDLGLLDVVLPFVLVFTLVFAVLQRTKVFGEEDGEPKVKINAMVSFVFGFVAVMTTNVLNLMNVLIRNVVVVMVALLLIAIVMGFVGISRENQIMKWLALIAFVIAVLFGFAEVDVIDLSRAQNLLISVIVIFIIIGVIWMILSKAEVEKPKKGKKKREKKKAPEFKPEKMKKVGPVKEISEEKLEKEGTIWEG